MDEAKTAEAVAQAYMLGRERVRIERAGRGAMSERVITSSAAATLADLRALVNGPDVRIRRDAGHGAHAALDLVGQIRSAFDGAYGLGIMFYGRDFATALALPADGQWTDSWHWEIRTVI